MTPSHRLLSTRALRSDRLRDDRRHQTIYTDALVFGPFRQLRVEGSGQALAPLSSFDGGLWYLSARLLEDFQTIEEGFPAIRDRLFNGLAVGHASGNIRILYQVAATLFPGQGPNRKLVLVEISIPSCSHFVPIPPAASISATNCLM